MSGFIVLPVNRDPIAAQDEATEVIRQTWPAWTASPADPMTALRDAAAGLYTETAEIATRVGEEIFRYYGRSVADLAPGDDLAATGVVTITAQDDDGPYAIPEGLEIEGRDELGQPVAFRVPAQAIIPNGLISLNVPVEAILEGTGGNGISGTADFSSYVDYLTDVEFVGFTGGGVDRELDEDYLDRLSEELKLQSPRPLLPGDFAVLARRFGAYRAVAVDGLNPVAGTTGNLATMTVAMMDNTGAPLGAVLRDSIAAQLQAMREIGWQVFAVNPNATGVVDVQYAAVAYPDADPVAAKAAADFAIADYLNPLTWGARRDTGDGRAWFNEPVVRWSEVNAAINSVETIRYVSSLGLRLQPSMTYLGAGVNVTLPGYVPLPNLGVVAGTVT